MMKFQDTKDKENYKLLTRRNFEIFLMRKKTCRMY